MRDAMHETVEQAFYELFAPLQQRAPGSAASSARALACVPGLDARRRVLELGCGGGLTSLQLAAALPEHRAALRALVLVRHGGELISVDRTAMPGRVAA